MAHNSCPKCGSGISGGGKTCGSCGAVSLQLSPACLIAYMGDQQLIICALIDLSTVASTSMLSASSSTMKEVEVSH